MSLATSTGVPFTITMEMSLQRHHYLYLDGGDVREKNSVMHYNLSEQDLNQDLKDFGNQVFDVYHANARRLDYLARDYPLTHCGRTYRVDIAPKRAFKGHFFALRGNKVWPDVEPWEWNLARAFRRAHRAAGQYLDTLVPEEFFTTEKRRIAKDSPKQTIEQAIILFREHLSTQGNSKFDVFLADLRCVSGQSERVNKLMRLVRWQRAD